MARLAEVKLPGGPPKKPKPLPIPRGWQARLGQAMRAERRAQGLNVFEVSICCGWDKNTVARWERGGNLRLDGFAALCLCLGVSPAEMLQRAGF